MQGEVRLTLMEKNFVNGKLFFYLSFLLCPLCSLSESRFLHSTMLLEAHLFFSQVYGLKGQFTPKLVFSTFFPLSLSEFFFTSNLFVLMLAWGT